MDEIYMRIYSAMTDEQKAFCQQILSDLFCDVSANYAHKDGECTALIMSVIMNAKTALNRCDNNHSA